MSKACSWPTDDGRTASRVSPAFEKHVGTTTPGPQRTGMKLICCLFAALSTWAVASHAMAQTSYSEKPIRILVGFPSGGPPDIAPRLLADRFSESSGQPVVVENVTGAGGNIAID